MRPDSPRGAGLKKGLEILQEVRKKFKLAVTTDVHEASHVDQVAEVVDLIQIPAFLSRQTDLIVEAAKTGKPINIKKGQFLSPWDMAHIVDKAVKAGNEKIILTERGTTFGYGYLVNDMRSIPIIKSLGFPVVFDAGHSVQLPGQVQGKSGGMRDMIPVLAKAAVAAGADGLFIEAHENPDKAISDGPNMIKLDDIRKLLTDSKAIQRVIR
jgi:2-dehydro-3-deoxyphosphooctonate aldolase (KDO 8-P synthase)